MGVACGHKDSLVLIKLLIVKNHCFYRLKLEMMSVYTFSSHLFFKKGSMGKQKYLAFFVLTSIFRSGFADVMSGRTIF